MRNRLLVTGASGLLGLNLSLAALEAGCDVVGVDKVALARTPFDLLQRDLLEPGAADRLVEETAPTWLIHCAALASLESCEKDPVLATRLNTDLPAGLAAACAKRGTRFVQVSTDSVFDGTRQGFYTEQDVPNPPGVYSTSKLNGEHAVLAAYPEAVVARVNFFGWSPSGDRSLAEYFFNNLSAGKNCDGFTDVWFCPMFVVDLAKTFLDLLRQGLSGLYHVVGSEALSKYDFGIRIARRFGFDEDLIRPISVERSTLTAKRSHNLRLSIHKLSTDLGVDIPGVSTGLEGFYTQYIQGYPQRIRSYQQA